MKTYEQFTEGQYNPSAPSSNDIQILYRSLDDLYKLSVQVHNVISKLPPNDRSVYEIRKPLNELNMGIARLKDFVFQKMPVTGSLPPKII